MTNDREQVTPGPEVALHSPEEFSPSGAAPFKAPQNMGVSKNRGTPNWMVYTGKPYQNG